MMSTATGTWTVQGGRVLLNTAGSITPPAFRLKQSASQPEKPLTIVVRDQNGRGLAGIDISIDYGDKNPETGYTQEYGRQAARTQGRPKAIGLGIRMYNLAPQWFKVAGTPENYYVFEFNPGGLEPGEIKRYPFDAGKWHLDHGAGGSAAEICEGAGAVRPAKGGQFFSDQMITINISE